MSRRLNEKKQAVQQNFTQFEYAYKVDLYYPLGGTPSISFRTADVVQNDDTGEAKLGEAKRLLQETYTPGKEFDVLNPETGDVIGTMTHDDLFVGLYSLFWDVADAEGQ